MVNKFSKKDIAEIKSVCNLCGVRRQLEFPIVLEISRLKEILDSLPSLKRSTEEGGYDHTSLEGYVYIQSFRTPFSGNLLRIGSRYGYYDCFDEFTDESTENPDAELHEGIRSILESI